MDKKKVSIPVKRGDKAKSNAALEKREEKLHKDLDGDGEKGESAAHRAKVLDKKAVATKKPMKAKK